MLLVGDSWAAQAWRATAFRTALESRGLANHGVRGAVTTISGSTAEEWATPAFLALITEELTSHPTIDIVHLSIGGNDFIRQPPSSLLEAILSFAELLGNIQVVVSHIHQVRPDVRVAYAVYDYVATGHGYAFELGILALGVRIVALLEPRLFLLNNLGVLHHAFGYPGAFGPGERPLPGSVPWYFPFWGGDPRYPGSPQTFRDAIHPTDVGYVRLAEHAVDTFYAEWLTAPIPASE
jgi:lysophospholipase L1-like esterase